MFKKSQISPKHVFEFEYLTQGVTVGDASVGFPTSGPTLLNSDTGDVGSFSVSTSFHIEITSLNTHSVPLPQRSTFQGMLG